MGIELGKRYKFDVLYKVERGIGNQRLRIQDAGGSQYECDMFPFQEDDMPNVVWCKWMGKYRNGLPDWVQDKGKLLKENFVVGEVYKFKVKGEQKVDFKTQSNYYDIADVQWGIGLRYYCDKTYHDGEILRLQVKKVQEDKGYLEFYREVPDKTGATSPQSADGSHAEGASPAGTYSSGEQYTPGEFGSESNTVEFKTSIVFMPGDSQPNIDKQLSTIVKEIAAFLNADGGTLYIGVNDKGFPVGMAEDYAHLNEGNDDYNGSYKNTTDSYENKIRNAVCQCLEVRASRNLKFEFPEKYAGTVCVIHITPLKRPVFYNGICLFERMGNQKKLLKGDDILFFIQKQHKFEIRDVIEQDQPVAIPATGTPSVTIPIPTASAMAKTDEVWNYFTYYATGEYSIQKEEKHDADIVAQVCVHKSEKNQRILLCYDNGCVASVEPADIYDSKYKGKRRRKGWNTKAKLMNVFVANTFDMLGAISIDATQRRWVKAHNVVDIGNPTDSMNAQGNTFIPKLGKVVEYKCIAGMHRNTIPGLLFQKADRTTTLGVLETMQQYLNEVNYFEKINTAEDKQ